MTDKLTKNQRSRNMSAVKGKNTSLELKVRSYLHKQGFRYRLHYNIPGKPDMVFVRKKIAVFINGCFWHQHNCQKAKLPDTNIEFWKDKLTKNKERDRENIRKLKLLGWRSNIIWECEIQNDMRVVIKRLF